MRQFLNDLKRRKMDRVAAVYAAVAFVVVEAADRVLTALNSPFWGYSLVAVLALLGLLLAFMLTRAFDVIPDGVERSPAAEPEKELDSEAEATPSPGSGWSSSRLSGTGLLLSWDVAVRRYLIGAPSEPVPSGEDRSIAVLLFGAFGQQEPDAFTGGKHDDLLARLSSVSGLKVISWTSVQQYRETRKTAVEIAHELGGRRVPEGGVQEMGVQVRANAHRIDPRTDNQAWGDTYRRELTSPLHSPSRISWSRARVSDEGTSSSSSHSRRRSRS